MQSNQQHTPEVKLENPVVQSINFDDQASHIKDNAPQNNLFTSDQSGHIGYIEY